MVSCKLRLSAALLGFLLAVPTLAAPSGDIGLSSLSAKNIIPREYIDQVLAYHEAKVQAQARAEWKNAKRALHELQKRVPVDQHCDHHDEWLARTCMTDISPRAYQDECQEPDGEEYEVDAECPENTTCQEIRINRGTDPATGEAIIEDDIICEPATPPRQDNVSGSRQYGYRSVSSSSSQTQDVAVQVLVDNASSAVSAEILSSDRSFVVKTVGTLTANLRGFNLNLCQQISNNAQHNSRQCIPTGTPHNLRSGQFIDFTFALSGLQTGFFFYSIL